MNWDPKLSRETADFANQLGTNKPPLVFTFGAFSYEFARRSLKMEPRKPISCWTTERLGEEFRQTVEAFNPREVNVFPLLHVSIARRHFLKSHKNFTGESNGNYFDFVARNIGNLLQKDKDTLNVWVEP